MKCKYPYECQFRNAVVRAVKEVENKIEKKFPRHILPSFYPTAPEPSEIDFLAQSTYEIDPRGHFFPIKTPPCSKRPRFQSQTSERDNGRFPKIDQNMLSSFTTKATVKLPDLISTMNQHAQWKLGSGRQTASHLLIPRT